jgi:hypothetical protein
MKLDFTPLTRPVSTEEKKQLKQNNLMKTRPIVVTVFGLLAIGTALFVFSSMSLLVVLIVLAIAVSFVGAIVVAHAHYKQRLMRMALFAQVNNLESTFMRPNPHYTGTLFEQGDSRRVIASYGFPGGIEVGNYSYTIGSGRSRTTLYWGYMRVKLVRRLPHMVLDATKNNSMGLSSFPGILSGASQLKLEGDFNNHFKLYVPPGYERDALYVFTPDVMAALIDYGNEYDIEVIDDWLVFASNKQIALHTEEGIRRSLRTLQEIAQELIPQGDYYADTRIGDRQQNLIAEPGRRLKRKPSIITAIVVLLILAAYTVIIAFSDFL